MAYLDSFMKRVQEDISKYGEKRSVVRASIVDILTVKKLSPDQMHANPDDDFSNPEIGPNEEIIDKYIEEAQKDMICDTTSFDEPIMVAKMEQGDYMIVNGHHRWAAAIKVGLKKVRVVVVNPGWEDMVDAIS